MDDARRLALSLLDSHGPRLFRVLLRLTLSRDVAEELFQDLLASLMRSPKWTRVADPAGYAFRTALNLAGQWRRAQKKLAVAGVPREPETTEPSPLESLVKREEQERVLEALAELPEAQQACLVMRYLEKRTPESIGQEFGKSAHHIRSICSKGLARLRQMLGNDD